MQISWLLQKPTDLDLQKTDLELHCLLKQDMSCSAREGLRNNIHELWKPIFLQKTKKKNCFKISSAEIITHYDWLIVLGFNDTSTPVSHFVSSSWEMEKKDRRDSRGDEREEQGRTRKWMDVKKQKK